ncbi:MAG TPA: TonB-dependent receptor plug domain-containing protein, partial [Caulobacterales bacterium]|nr:TonB-dependent receptor plug domain-containing protein [Caulobacterales bacterium]
MFSKRFLSGAALTALSISMGGAAYAQSTASQITEDEVVVTGARRTVDGAISAESGAKARSTITQAFIEQQTPGQTILEQINLIPGVSFSNNDAYGTSGGELNIRGFDSARISLTFDGIQLNDTGNYAIYSNQQLDPELIARANVNLGSTDVDSPTASATGGTVNYVTRTPSDDFGVMLNATGGSNEYRRVFALLDSGKIGPWDTSLFGAVSDQTYNQFVGPGTLTKHQYNLRVYQPIGSGADFVSVAVHFNQNRNDFYRRVNLLQFNAGTANSVVYDGSCTFTTNQCSNYRGVNINPSDTGNVRIQSRFDITPNLTFTLDPSYQYVLADGGGTFTFAENDARLIGTAAPAVASRSVNASCATITGPQGVDLNGDCDTNDSSIRVYEPNITNTHRFMVLSSLLWDISSTNHLRFGYTWDHGNHRQTGEMTLLNSQGEPLDVFGAKGGRAEAIPTLDGNIL